LVGSSAKPVQCRNQPGLGNLQKRTRQQHALALGLTRHRGQTGDAAAPQHPHQQGLGLVIAGMRGEDMGRAARARRPGQQLVPRGARGRRQSGAGFLTRPAHGPVGHVEALGQPPDVARLACGLGPEAMIDGDRHETRPARQAPPPACRKPHQGHRIRPAGYRKHDGRRTLPFCEQTFGVLDRNYRIIFGHGVVAAP
jgi:hypothetical protein